MRAQNFKFPSFLLAVLYTQLLLVEFQTQFPGYNHRIKIILRLRKAGDQALIFISSILKFSAQTSELFAWISLILNTSKLRINAWILIPRGLKSITYNLHCKQIKIPPGLNEDYERSNLKVYCVIKHFSMVLFIKWSKVI